MPLPKYQTNFIREHYRFSYAEHEHEKVGPILSSLNPRASLPFVATVDKKQYQCLNDKTEPLFLEYNECNDTF